MNDSRSAARLAFEVVELGRSFDAVRIEGHEAISAPYQFDVDLVGEDEQIDFGAVVGRRARLVLYDESGGARTVHGIVAGFEQGDDAPAEHLFGYRATLVPETSRLEYRRDCRIFQQLSVPDIVRRVLTAAGLPNDAVRLSLQNEHRPREYCVQYRESDWDFVSRLLEEEGIFYFFDHDGDREVMVLGDTPFAHRAITGPEGLSFRASGAQSNVDGAVSRFRYREQIRPDRVTLRDFNFVTPHASLESKARVNGGGIEVYDYPGEYDDDRSGTAAARVRLDAEQTARRIGEGESACTRLVPGSQFVLHGHPRAPLNRRYVITRVVHRGHQPLQGGGTEGTRTPAYRNEFSCIPDDVGYRPAMRTPRPTVRGVQTAVVVGPAGEEIYTDEHGRVKVQFHWDREGRHDENSSCWIRVSQVWAGAGWGGLHIPRVGQEVVVDFLEGDPDRPLVTGTVYHAANRPPYDLPAEKTRSTLKSSSTPGGQGSNELRFDDAAGREEVYLHAQRDWHIAVENDKQQRVGHDESLDVGNDRDKMVGGNQTERIVGSKSIQVGGVHVETIAIDETVNVGGTSMRTVALASNEKVGGEKTVDVGTNLTQVVGSNLTLVVGENKVERVAVASEENVGGEKTLAIDGAYAVQVGGEMNTTVAGDLSEDVRGSRRVTVQRDLEIVCGTAKITIRRNGAVVIEGEHVTVKSPGSVRVEGTALEVKSRGPVTVRGSGIGIN